MKVYYSHPRKDGGQTLNRAPGCEYRDICNSKATHIGFHEAQVDFGGEGRGGSFK